MTPSFESALSRELERLDSDRSVLVERLSYGSSFTAQLIFSGDFIPKTLAIIRGWKADKRVGDAKARVAEAFASNYEDQVRHEQLMRSAAEQQLLAGDLRISRDQLQALLTPEIIKSLISISGATLEITGDDSQGLSDTDSEAPTDS